MLQRAHTCSELINIASGLEPETFGFLMQVANY